MVSSTAGLVGLGLSPARKLTAQLISFDDLASADFLGSRAPGGWQRQEGASRSRIVVVRIAGDKRCLPDRPANMGAGITAERGSD